MRCAVLLVLAGAAAAALRGPASYADQADDIKSMMENVRAQTEGGPVAAPVKKVSHDAAQSGDFFPGEQALDDQLMKKADQVQLELANMKDPTLDQTPKKAALSSVKAESTEERAARYFATHGMKKVGHMLGEELDSKEEKAVVAEHDADEQKIQEQLASAPYPPPVHKANSDAVQSTTELEDPGMDDDDNAEYKKKWAMVDALKQRHLASAP